MSTTIKIGEHEIELVKPSALFALGCGIGQTEEGNTPLFYARAAAALAVCWPKDRPWPYKPRPYKWKSSKRLEDYGEEIFNDLSEWAHSQDIPQSEIVSAAADAFTFAARSTLTNAQLEEARKKLEALREGGSETDSTSVESTDKAPIGGSD